ncbi:MAG: hypothetical protein ACJ0J5_01670 [Dehalococcoidia bacterium]|mgnify:FL=1|nr:hypothetical protein [Chloroflexota bacterium]OUW96495.1 MAG: hypothetical protein CBD90_01050 [Chloroflexi bacterium TMED230]RZP13395.1 MAG: hypothetical protein EVA32_04710 [Chloroflexota bacterium]
MSTKTLGWLLVIFPILGLLSWATAGLPATPAGEIEGGYAAYATEIGNNSDRIHINMGVAAIVFTIFMASFIGLRAKVLEKGKSNFAFLAGILIAIGYAGTIAENGAYSAAASLSKEGLIQESISMLTLATTAGGFGTSILALGIGFLGYSMYKNKTIHLISSSAFMCVGVGGVIGGILYYDQGIIAAYYFSLVITSVATGIELIRTAKD